MYIRSRIDLEKFIIFAASNLVSYTISFILAYALRFGTFAVQFRLNSVSSLYLIFSAVMLIINALLRLSDNILKRGYIREFTVTLVHAVLSLSFATLVLFVMHFSSSISRLLVLYSSVLFVFVDYLLRGVIVKRLYIAYLKNNAAARRHPVSSFIVTNRSDVSSFLQDMREHEYRSFDVKGIVFADGAVPPEGMGDLHVCDTFEDAARFICCNWIDEVIIYLPQGDAVPESFLTRCREMGLIVHQIVRFSDVERKKQFVEDIGSHVSLTTVFNYIAPYQAFFKRALDILGGLVGSLAAVLIGIVIGPMIYIASPGPIIFRQKRVGKNGKYFYVLKFRSMYLDAEDRKKDLMTENRVSDGMMFKLEFDPRVIGNRILPDGTKKTSIGEFIRKTSLDEFPQFFNVLRGDMSLVGTRPPTVDEWEKYEFHHRARLAVKSGITGLWQISGRSEITDFEEVVRLDTEYIANFRLSSDIKILLKTVPALLRRKGAM